VLTAMNLPVQWPEKELVTENWSEFSTQLLKFCFYMILFYKILLAQLFSEPITT
jgi:hypothetical protein